MSFPCTGCGACCNRISKAVENTKGWPGFEFPYGWNEAGRCDMLGEDNKCQVYDNRPLLCDIDRVAEALNLNKEEFYNQNINACNAIMDADNISKSLRIK